MALFLKLKQDFTIWTFFRSIRCYWPLNMDRELAIFRSDSELLKRPFACNFYYYSWLTSAIYGVSFTFELFLSTLAGSMSFVVQAFEDSVVFRSGVEKNYIVDAVWFFIFDVDLFKCLYCLLIFLYLLNIIN